MKTYLPPVLVSLVVMYSTMAFGQAASPALVITSGYVRETVPAREMPRITSEEWDLLVAHGEKKILNPKIRTRSFPYAETALPAGSDPVWQRQGGAGGGNRTPIMSFNGQTSPYYPPDANGSVGPDHYMQTINAVFTIYDKQGALVTGPTALNTLFEGLPGSSCNNGDPIVLYDEQANRWLISEFSLCEATDYLLVAISATSNPTGTWYAYSFDVADMPDYPKFGVWRDGYYLGTNNPSGNDIYVFERSKMLLGQPAQAVGFNNPWRPMTNDGFMCVPPVDNDGPFAPMGQPGIFITINDDAVGGGSDQLWIYELSVDWNNPSLATFNRVQQINVAPFDSNFGLNWENITQPGTTRKLDAVPQVLMNPPQYRNFGSHQTIVCCHTVDVDGTDHAGIRWYELRKTDGDWQIRQQSTYGPDEHSRWMGSIMLNGHNEIALAYSISSNTLYPGIRYCGQSSVDYLSGSGILDVAEEIIHTGEYAQTLANRWGDYASLQVDPSSDQTFWFTGQYIDAGAVRKTRIANFEIPDPPGSWTGLVSADWNDPGNWAGEQVPDSSMQVFIESPAPHYPLFSGNLVVGAHCDKLHIYETGNLTVFGDLLINPGKRLAIADSGLVILWGNLAANGFFSGGKGLIMFAGPAQFTISRGAVNQMVNFERSVFNRSMTPLQGGAPGPNGDNEYMDVTLGFPFIYAGTAYTQARLSTNGWLSLNRTGTISNANTSLFSATTPNATLAPWFDDLRADEASLISYATEGEAPNRVFTAEWKSILTYKNSTARVSFQLKLFETSNRIEFHYGNYESGGHSNNESASIGIENATGGSGNFIDAITGSTTNGVTNLVSRTDWPLVNYRFSPAIEKISFHHLIINNAGGNLNLNTDVEISGELNLLPGSSVIISGGKTLSLDQE